MKKTTKTTKKASDGEGIRITFRCPPILRDAIEALADKEQRTVSNWIVVALTEQVNRKEF